MPSRTAHISLLPERIKISKRFSEVKFNLTGSQALVVVEDDCHVVHHPLGIQILESHCLDFKSVRLKVPKAVLEKDSVRCLHFLDSVLVLILLV